MISLGNIIQLDFALACRVINVLIRQETCTDTLVRERDCTPYSGESKGVLVFFIVPIFTMSRLNVKPTTYVLVHTQHTRFQGVNTTQHLNRKRFIDIKKNSRSVARNVY